MVRTRNPFPFGIKRTASTVAQTPSQFIKLGAPQGPLRHALGQPAEGQDEEPGKTMKGQKTPWDHEKSEKSE